MNNEEIIEQFIDHCLLLKNLSENSVSSYREDLKIFSSFLSKNFPNTTLEIVSQDEIESYITHLYNNNYNAKSIQRFLSCFRSFIKYCHINEIRKDNPVANIPNPKTQKNLPDYLTETEVELLLNAPDLDNPLELRDKAMLEFMYASGLRVSELIDLKFTDISIDEQIVRIIGKGDKERLVPFSQTTSEFIIKYYKEVRSFIKTSKDQDYFFLSKKNTHMTRQAFWYRIKYYMNKIGSSKNIHPHTLRHSFATHLLNNGANLLAIQKLLGHESINTTQIYTKVANEHLKKLHELNHPRSK